MATNKIAVLLAAFNGKRWLDSQIQSILSQKDVLVHIFISVDQSSDGTELLVEQIQKKTSQVTVLPCGIRYGSAAANFFHLLKTVDCSDFDYVALSDQDDIWQENKIIRALSQLQIHNASAYSGNVIAFWENGKQLCINKSQLQTKWDFLFEAAGPGCTYVLSNQFAMDLRKFLIARYDDMQSIKFHDWFIYAYGRAHNYNWVIDPSAYMMYRQHMSNEIGANIGLSAFLKRSRKIFNGFWINQSFNIAQLIGLGRSPFICKWSGQGRLGYIYLAFHCLQCRRRVRDKFLFFFVCLSLAILGVKIKQ